MTLPAPSSRHRMTEMASFHADWWNDSCDLVQLREAVAAGATGATSNPVIVEAAVSQNRAYWMPVIERLVIEHDAETEEEIAWRLIAEMGRQAAAILAPLHERTGGRQGWLCLQVNPKFYRSSARMVEQGVQLAALAPNIAIKLPAIAPGLAAMEELTAQGILVNATVSFSVAQAVAAAAAIERGCQRRRAGTGEARPFVTLMVGRISDHLQRCRDRDGVVLQHADAIPLAGAYVFKAAACLFQQREYTARLLAAAYRHELHWSEIVGRDVIQSVPYEWWRKFAAAERPVRASLDEPADPAILAELRSTFPDFAKVCDETEMGTAAFAEFAPTRLTLRQFIAGYDKLLALVREVMLPPA